METPKITAIDLNLGTYKVYDATLRQDVNKTVQGTLYTVEGVFDGNNQLRKLSIAELVMVVCLARAAEKEQAVIDLMREMSETTNTLNTLTDIEKQLLDGKNLSEISGEWSYNGTTYTTATELLGAVGVITLDQNHQTLVTLARQLESYSVFDLTGSYYFNGTTYNNAYQLLKATGCLTYNSYWGSLISTRPVTLTGQAYNRSSVEAYEDAENLVNKGYGSLSNTDRSRLWSYYGINYDVPFTSQTMGYVVENMFYNAVVSRNLNNMINAIPAVVGSPTTDQLITDIESKMDSLNSFSQQKMIELQSETNKRDQAYDMITNILKSLNTVEVGIVNNI